jgi:YbgC/YbaW family acyl-CoA thioester hydrolase
MFMSQTPLKFIVPFDEADGEGIVFFGNYFRLAHRALEQYLPTLNISWNDWFKNPGFGVPLRHVEADYLKPLRPGEAYQVLMSVAEIGESSVHFSYEFSHPNGDVCARLKTSHVFVARPGMKKMTVPADIREKLANATR